MQLGERRKKLDSDGRGLCSVPMWNNGLPAGFCENEAYGDNDPKKYDGYVGGLACPDHGGPKVRVFMDGNMYCAVKPDFITLQESPAGFGETKDEAIKELHQHPGLLKQ